MALCPYCDHRVAFDAASCPNCGKQKPAEDATFFLGLWLIGGLLLILAPGLVVNYLIDANWGLFEPAMWLISIGFWSVLFLGYLIFRKCSERDPSGVVDPRKEALAKAIAHAKAKKQADSNK